MEKHDNIILEVLNCQVDSKYLDKFEKEHSDIWTTETIYFKDEYRKSVPTKYVEGTHKKKLAIMRPSLQYDYNNGLVDFRIKFAEKLAKMVLKGMK